MLNIGRKTGNLEKYNINPLASIIHKYRVHSALKGQRIMVSAQADSP